MFLANVRGPSHQIIFLIVLDVKKVIVLFAPKVNHIVILVLAAEKVN